MTTSYVLSIGIPTWNRCPYLQENIDQLLREIAKTPDCSIEIFVSDNASTDETQAYCEALSQHYPFFTYHRNDTNLGANANFQNVIALSQGEYVWMLGDDDLIVEDCLSSIVRDIAAFQQPDIVIGGCLNDTNRQRLYPPFLTESLLTDQSIIQQYDAIQLAGKISVLIFKRNRIVPLLPQAWHAITTLKTPWPHLIWFILLLNQHANILFLPYSTNYFIEANRYNMLQDGISRTNIMIKEYANLIEYLKPTLTHDFYRHLVKSISHQRQVEFLKIVAYTAYLNPYGATVSNAWRVFKQLPGMDNKGQFLAFYFLPVLLPRWLRKALLYLPAYFSSKSQAYQAFIAYLKQAQLLLRQKEQDKRQVFDKEGL